MGVLQNQWSRLVELDWTSIGVVLAISIVIFLGFWIFRKVVTQYIFNTILRYVERSKYEIDTSVLVAFEKPIRTLFIFIGLYFSLRYVVLELPLAEARQVAWVDGLFTLLRSVVIVNIAWGLFNLTGESSVWLERIGRKFDYKFDNILLPFLSRIFRFIIIALTFSIVAREFKYDVNGFIAGLGLGGLAFALAAKDTIGNIFGGIVIITEKPFTIGDWIETPSVEGTVEELTFRSTKVRTFSQALVTVPNSTLADQPITNWSKMGRRRISFHLGVTYSTPRHKIEACVSQIRDMLRKHEAIDQQTLFVHFDKFNDSSLDIFLYFFTKPTEWGEWLKVKEDCNLKMMEILENEGVSIAFPSRSIYVENTVPKKTDPFMTPDHNDKNEIK